MGYFIIEPPPVGSRTFLGASRDGFLWKESEKIYVMGNHRLALWCWLQIDNICSQDYELIHIDGHFDCSFSTLADDMYGMPGSIKKLKDIEYYRGLKYEDGIHKVLWDNFLSVAIKVGLFSHYYFFVNQQSIEDDTLFNNEWLGINKSQYDYCPDVRAAMDSICSLLKSSSKKYILNIDLDYFYKEVEADYEFLVPYKVIKSFFTGVKAKFDNVVLMTIALSPSFSWKEDGGTTSALSIAKSIFNMGISL
ncbi:MAG: UPF0489 family protein [Candidatus Pacebacteria bacterium]|nr:UPF0489 family protein [Candidatus Paceibacterota bacterium]